MSVGGGEAGAGDRRERHVSSFTFVKDDSDKYFVRFTNLARKTVCVEVPSPDVSLALLKVLVLEAFEYDAEEYSVKLIFNGKVVTKENFDAYKSSNPPVRHVVFSKNAVA